MPDIELAVTNTATYVVGKLSSENYHGLKKKLSYMPENAKFMVKHFEEKRAQDPHQSTSWKWDGSISKLCYPGKCRCYTRKKGMHFPTGLLTPAREYLSTAGISYSLVDRRKEVLKKQISLSMSDEFETRDYQKKLIDRACLKGRGIIKAATGSGKTSIGAAIISELGVAPFIFYVSSKDLLQQAHDEITRFVRWNGVPLEVGMIGNGKCDIKDINVMTVQTAIRACGEKWIKCDDEDKSKDNTINDDRIQSIRELITRAKGIIADECVTGDTLIETDKGLIRIDEVKIMGCKKVLSYNGNSLVWKDITAFIPRKKKQVIEIKLNSGEIIKCTKNHPLMTQKGWLEAGKITKKDKILKLANVDVNRFFLGVDKYTSLDIKSKQDLYQNGKKSINKYAEMLQNVNAAAERRSSQKRLPWKSSSEVVEQKDIVNSVMDMIKDLKSGSLNLWYQKNEQYLEHFLEILLYVCQVQKAKIIDYMLTMDCCKKNGYLIKPHFCIDYRRVLENLRIQDMVKCLSVIIQDAYLVCKKFLTSFQLKEEKQLIENGLILLGKLDWHGGSLTMEVIQECCESTQKVILLMNKKLLQIGSKTTTEKLKLKSQKINIIISALKLQQEIGFFQKLENTFHNACSTSLSDVVEITELKPEKVYDINVDETHCFFANNMLVHNCQHWAAETCQVISEYSVEAKYRFALSATPRRDLGDDILIDACFGKTIGEISASYLIKRGFLVKPNICFIPIKNETSLNLRTYDKLYKACITENKIRNQIIANIANDMQSEGRTILVLCKQIKHGQTLEKMIDGSIFLSGSVSSKKRKAHLDKMRQRKSGVTIASVIFDEGIDCKPLDTLILAGSGKSSTRALQRVGRILRPYPGKTDAIAIDFMDHAKYMLAHSKKRRRMYGTEEEFDIRDIKM